MIMGAAVAVPAVPAVIMVMVRVGNQGMECLLDMPKAGKREAGPRQVPVAQALPVPVPVPGWPRVPRACSPAVITVTSLPVEHGRVLSPYQWYDALVVG